VSSRSAVIIKLSCHHSRYFLYAAHVINDAATYLLICLHRSCKQCYNARRARLAKRMAEEASAAHKRDTNRTVEPGVTELICGLLSLDPAKRLTASQTLQLDYLSAQQHAIAAPLPVDEEDDGM
jgi:hypothetical protein